MMRIIVFLLFALTIITGAIALQLYNPDFLESASFLASEEDPDPADPAKLGSIFVESPEIYTRERLVNDRYEQDAWLRKRLGMTDDMEFGVQAVRDVRETTKAIARANLGIDLTGGGRGRVDKGQNDDAADRSKSEGAGAGSRPDPDKPKAAWDRAPIDDFRDRVAYREEVRNAIIENQLDERHDLDGNTLYRLKFDATVIPMNKNKHLGKIVVRVKPQLTNIKIDGYQRYWSASARARAIETWTKDHAEEARLWHRVYEKYLDGYSQWSASEFAKRVKLIRAILEGEEPLDELKAEERLDLRLIRRDVEQLVELRSIEDFFEIVIPVIDPTTRRALNEIRAGCRTRSRDGASNGLLLEAGHAPENGANEFQRNENPLFWSAFEKISNANCVYDALTVTIPVQAIGTPSPKRRIKEKLIAIGLCKHFDGSNDGPAIRASRSRTRQYAKLVCDRTFGDIVRAEAFATKIKIYPISPETTPEPVVAKTADGRELICKKDNEAIFNAITGRVSNVGVSLDELVTGQSLIYKLNRGEFEIDPQTGNLSCIANDFGINRVDGFVDFLEAFMDAPAKPSFSYTITPKESVQRLQDDFSRSNALSALAAVGLASNVGNAAASASAFEDLQETYSGGTRHPLVVGFTTARHQSDRGDLSFGWIIAPKLQASDNGKAPDFRHVLSQHSLSALISVPAWWHAVNLEVETFWVAKDGTETSIESGKREYKNVRLPGDLHETRRILYPKLDKAPSIDRDQMDIVFLKQPDADLRTATATGESDESKEDPIRLVIPGSNLWRSTVVTLGAEPARRIWVMPNMGGIVAEFERVPPVYNDKPKPVALRVWTSEGVDAVYDKVVVLPLRKMPPDASPVTAAVDADQTAPAFDSATTADAAPTKSKDTQVAAAPDTSEPVTAAPVAPAAPAPTVAAPEDVSTVAEPDEPAQLAETAKKRAAAVSRLDEKAQTALELLGPLDLGQEQDVQEAIIITEQLAQQAKSVSEIDHSGTIVQEVAKLAEETETALKRSAQDGQDAETINAVVADLREKLVRLQGELEEYKRPSKLSLFAETLSLVALDGPGRSLIRRDEGLGFGFRSPQFKELADLRLDLAAGLRNEDGFVVTLVSVDKEELQNDTLIVTFSAPELANGTKLQPFMRLRDEAFGFDEIVPAQNSLIYYSDEKRATIRIATGKAELEEQTLTADFTMLLPARMFETFPEIENSDLIVKANVRSDSGYQVVETELYPRDSSISIDPKGSRDSSYEMMIAFPEDVRGDVVAQLKNQVPIELQFELIGLATQDAPRILSELTIDGLKGAPTKQ